MGYGGWNVKKVNGTFNGCCSMYRAPNCRNKIKGFRDERNHASSGKSLTRRVYMCLSKDNG